MAAESVVMYPQLPLPSEGQKTDGNSKAFATLLF